MSPLKLNITEWNLLLINVVGIELRRVAPHLRWLTILRSSRVARTASASRKALLLDLHRVLLWALLRLIYLILLVLLCGRRGRRCRLAHRRQSRLILLLHRIRQLLVLIRLLLLLVRNNSRSLCLVNLLVLWMSLSIAAI